MKTWILKNNIQVPEVLERRLDKLRLVGRKICGYGFSGVLFDYLCGKRLIGIDVPFVLRFDDGHFLAIDYSEASTVTLGMDVRLKPSNEIRSRTRRLDEIIGEEITGTKVISGEEFPFDFTGSFGIDLDENQSAYICRVEFELSGGKTLCFSNYFDYVQIWVKLRENSAVS